MELKEFTKQSIKEITEAIDDVASDTDRDIYLVRSNESRDMEFDVAVSIESTGTFSGEAKGGIQVLGLDLFRAALAGEDKTANSTISRIRFGISVGEKKGTRQPSGSGVIPNMDAFSN